MTIDVLTTHLVWIEWLIDALLDALFSALGQLVAVAGANPKITLAVAFVGTLVVLSERGNIDAPDLGRVVRGTDESVTTFFHIVLAAASGFYLGTTLGAWLIEVVQAIVSGLPIIGGLLG